MTLHYLRMEYELPYDAKLILQYLPEPSKYNKKKNEPYFRKIWNKIDFSFLKYKKFENKK
jgi:hypothetical protein